MNPIRVYALLALFFWAVPGWAQGGPTEIVITGPHGRGHHKCYALQCVNRSPQETQGYLRNLARIVENDCSRRSQTYQQDRCEKAQDELAAAKDCYENQCSRATCRSRELNTNRCLSQPYFR